MTKKYFDGKVPAAPAGAEENPLREIADTLYAEYDKCMGDVDFTGAAAAVQKLASRVNLYVEDSAPWNLAKSEETADELAAVIYNALEAIRIIALYMAPLRTQHVRRGVQPPEPGRYLRNHRHRSSDGLGSA